MTPARPPLQFAQIDVLRGAAALTVVVYHAIHHLGWESFPVTGPLLWFRIGWMGVDLFFVISGLVIALAAFSMLDRLEAAGAPVGMTRTGLGPRVAFMRRRLRRIVPLHYLTCLVFVAFSMPALMQAPDFWRNALTHLLFVHNLDWRYHGAINGPNWTIGVEMQFYLAMALLAPWLRTCRWWTISLVLIPLAWAWRYGVFATVPIDPEAGPFLRFVYVTQLPGVADQFAIGVLLARALRSERLRDRLAAPAPWLVGAVIVAAVLAVWAMLTVFWSRAEFWSHPGMVTFFRTGQSGAFALVVLAACLLNSRRALRATAPLRPFGVISYGIYLWHLPVLLAVAGIEGLAPVHGLAATLILTVSIAAVSWRWFERPLLGRLPAMNARDALPLSKTAADATQVRPRCKDAPDR